MLKPTVPQRFDLKTETRFKDYVLRCDARARNKLAVVSAKSFEADIINEGERV